MQANILNSDRPAPLKRVVLLTVFAANCVSGIHDSGDLRWAIPTALSVIREGNFDLDEYKEIIAKDDNYGVRFHNGHIYNEFPVGPAILSLPFVFIANEMLAHIPISLHESIKRRLPTHLEGGISSVFAAVAALFVFMTVSRLGATKKRALLLTALFAFGTSMWSCAGAMTSNIPTAMLLAIALYLVVRAREEPRWIQYASLPLAFAFVTRPNNAVSIVVVSVFVFAHHRRFFPRFVLWSLPIAVPFVVMNLVLFQDVLPWYYRSGRIGWHDATLTALAGNVISPARGVFVFSPVLLFAIWGAIRGNRRAAQPGAPTRDPLDFYILAMVILHWVAISLFPHWWGGWSFGPRFMTDVLPFFFFFLVPALDAITAMQQRARRVAVALFVVASAMSVFIHARGATSSLVHEWSASPNVDEHPERLWDLSDLQFLRGL